MLRKLKDDQNLTVKSVEPGIYYLNGDVIPIQIIIVPQLSAENNYWLNKLRNNLKSGGEIKGFLKEYEEKKESKLFRALADAVMRANRKEVEAERRNMCDAIKEIFAEEFNAYMEKGKAEGKIETVIKKYKKGCTVEETADMLEESPKFIDQIYKIIHQYEPDYDVEKIYKVLSGQAL